MTTLAFPIINTLDDITNPKWLARKALIALGIIAMALMFAALVLTVALVKVLTHLIKEFTMSRPQIAKRSLAPAQGFQTAPKTITVSATRIREIVQPAPTETPKAPDTASLEYLQQLAKAHKVKGWNFYKSPENLEKTLKTLGVL